MSTEVSHRACIAITNLKTAGRIDDTTRALLDRIEELECELDGQDNELARLRRIALVADQAADISARLGRDPQLSKVQGAIDALSAIEEIVDRTNQEKRDGQWQ